MDGEIATKVGGLLTFGALLVWLGIDGWIKRREERGSIIEAAKLKAAIDQPQAVGPKDRMAAYVRPVLMLLIGPAMIGTGIMMAITEWRMT